MQFNYTTRHDRIISWHRSFCYTPKLCTDTGKYVWLESVYRKGTPYTTDGDHDTYSFEYRQTPALANE